MALLAVWLFLPGFTFGDKADQAPAEEKDVKAGHSMHGEAFNEGPRQRAYLMGNTGQIDFAITTREPQARQFFNQGVGQLHGFWYFEAERSFRQAAALDPSCAMAYWGMAMANWENPNRAKGFLQKAVQRKAEASRREQLYIDGLAAYVNSNRDKTRKQAYIKSLEDLLHEYPDDLEAKAFLVVRLWQFKGELPIVSHQAVDALLDQVFAVNPMHPAHHYRIHLWDGVKPERALGSAARCGQSAPAIAHQWHMSGHIYSRLRRYHDAAWEQEASSRLDHAHMIRDRVLPDQIHNYPHNQEWLIRNLNHLGRYHDALALAKNLIELPRHPKYNTLQKTRTASYGRTRLFETLERYELWDELIQLCDSAYLEPTELPAEQVKRLRYLGMAYGNKGDADGLQKQIKELETRLSQPPAEPAVEPQADKKEPARTEPKPEGQQPKEQTEPPPKTAPKTTDTRAALEDALAELRGYEALLAGRPQAALEQFGKAKHISKPHLARLYLAAGEKQKAEELARQAVESSLNEVVPLANYIALLHAAGKTREAGEAFHRLRQISGSLDALDAPVFQRLEPVAKALQLPADWRQPWVPANDLGVRPALESLGPLTWRPAPAPSWSLSNGSATPVSLEQYRGRPVVLIFYLGHGCIHCLEQLKRFAPKAEEFADAGISLVAVSTDSVADLKKSPDPFKDDKRPFPVLADPGLEVFKAYRAFDDFENVPLHGTFLIDAGGLVRWQDISYEPFLDADFLLKEAKRLLKVPVK
jgi:peroxiredoxin/Tfp pilus assembly protein PilF